MKKRNKTFMRETFTRRSAAYHALVSMPPLSHWPDRSIPYSNENSEVIQFIAGFGHDFNEAFKIFVIAQPHNINLIRFNSETKLWQGTADMTKLKAIRAYVPHPNSSHE